MVTVALNDGWLYLFTKKDMFKRKFNGGGTCTRRSGNGYNWVILGQAALLIDKSGRDGLSLKVTLCVPFKICCQNSGMRILS
jgi:hypothetical protein